MKHLTSIADSFIYVVSTLGVTGARTTVNKDLPEFLKTIRSQSSLPLAVGFGVSTREHFLNVGSQAEGVVIGSKLISILKMAPAGQRGQAVKSFALEVTGRSLESIAKSNTLLAKETDAFTGLNKEAAQVSHTLCSRFGEYGGQYAPESLVECLEEIEKVRSENLYSYFRNLKNVSRTKHFGKSFALFMRTWVDPLLFTLQND